VVDACPSGRSDVYECVGSSIHDRLALVPLDDITNALSRIALERAAAKKIRTEMDGLRSREEFLHEPRAGDGGPLVGNTQRVPGRGTGYPLGRRVVGECNQSRLTDN
jgi:hypothetical protein